MTAEHRPIPPRAKLPRLAPFILVVGLLATAVAAQIRTASVPGASPVATDTVVDWGD